MADSTTPLFTLSASQNNQEARINELFDAASPATYFGRNADTSTGLTWGYFAAKVLINGTPTTVASGTKTLTASATNYISVSQEQPRSRRTPTSATRRRSRASSRAGQRRRWPTRTRRLPKP